MKFVIVDKNKYQEYQRVKELKEETRSYMISDNLSDTKATRFIRKMNSGAKLMTQSIPKPPRFHKGASRGTSAMVRKTRDTAANDDGHDDVLASLNANRNFNNASPQTIENNMSFSKDLNMPVSKVELRKNDRIPIYASLNQRRLKYNAVKINQNLKNAENVVRQLGDLNEGPHGPRLRNYYYRTNPIVYQDKKPSPKGKKELKRSEYANEG